MLTERLQKITDELIAKKMGIKVYASNRETTPTDTYMFVTNGKVVLYIQDDGGFFGISVTLEYSPDRDNGAGCRIDEEDALNVESIITADKIVKYLEEFSNNMTLKTIRKYNKFIKPCVSFYEDADEWYESLWRKNEYQLYQ